MVFFFASVSYFDKWNVWMPFLVISDLSIINSDNIYREYFKNTYLSFNSPSIQLVWQPGTIPKLLFPCIIYTLRISIVQRVWRKIIFNNNKKLTKYRNISNLHRREIGM